MYGNLDLRPARADERQALEALQRRASLALEEYRAALLAHPDAIDLPAGQIEAGQIVVAESHGALIGFAAVVPREDGKAELDGMFVDPDHWRRGIGSRLMSAAEALAVAGRAGFLCVIANPGAEAFYSSCGFRTTGRRQMRFGPALVMEKALPEAPPE